MAVIVTMVTPVSGTRTTPFATSVPLKATVAGGIADGGVAFYYGSSGVAVKITDATYNSGTGQWEGTWIGLTSNDTGSYGVWARAVVSSTPYLSAQSIFSIPGSTLSPVGVWVGDFEPNAAGESAWAQIEAGYQGTAPVYSHPGAMDNWPLGYVRDGVRDAGFAGVKPGITIMKNSVSGQPVRLGDYSLRVFLEQGQSNNIINNFDTNHTIDAAWWVPGVGVYPGTTYPAGGTYKVGSQRPAAYLPTDATPVTGDAGIGREVYWGYSFRYDGAFNNTGLFYAGGPDFHADNSQAGNVSYTGMRIYNDRFLMTIRGSNSPGVPSPWYQVDYAFNADASYGKAVPNVGSGDPNFDTISPSTPSSPWTKIQNDIWYDFIDRFVWSDNKQVGLLQKWCQVNGSGVYKLVIPTYKTTTLYTYNGSANPISAGIRTYFGMYRSRSITYQSQMYIDQLRRGPTAYDVMIPGSTFEVAGTGSTPGGATTAKAATIQDDFSSPSASSAIWTPRVDP